MPTAVCVVLDVGIHMSPDMDQTIECLKLLIQRKFFAQEKEELALVVCGSEATDNSLADSDGNFSHITLVRELAPLDWDLLEFLNSDSLLSTDAADVLDAVMVGVDHLMQQCKNRKGVTEKRVLLLSNLSGPMDDSRLSEIIDNLRLSEAQFSLIGHNFDDSTQTDGLKLEGDTGSDRPGPSRDTRKNEDIDWSKLKPSLNAVQRVWAQLNGESYTLDEAIPALVHFQTRAVAQRGWKVDLELSDSVSLPLEAFTQVKEAKPPAMRLMYAANPTTPIRLVTTYHAQDEHASQLDSSEVVRGYRYGSTLVPFSNEDRAAIKVTSEKSLSLIGFTQASNVPRSLYVGDSVMVFVANSPTQDTNSDTAGVAALAQALFELQAVALVRRVYNRVSAPRLGVLTPEIRGTQITLAYTDIAFAEDVRSFVFPGLPVRSHAHHPTSTTPQSLISAGPSDDQLDAMNAFVDSMMMLDESSDTDSDADDDDDIKSKEGGSTRNGLSVNIRPERLPNPWIQRLFTCFRQRGLQPTDPLIPSSSISSCSTQPTDHGINSPAWLDAAHLPGLESLLAQLDSVVGSLPVQATRRQLVDCMPSLLSKRDNATGDESGASIAKRRRLMATELFGMDAEQSSNPALSSNAGEIGPSTSSIVSDTLYQVTDVGSVDPIGDFDKLVARGQFVHACERLQARIIQLVTDPYTGSILRPKAISCLAAYRDRSISSGNGGVSIDSTLSMALAYNTFLRAWLEDLEIRGLIPVGPSPGQTSADDARLSFWRETITQGFGLITDEQVPGVGVTTMEATNFVQPSVSSAPQEVSRSEPPATEDKQPEIEELLDEME